MPEEKVENPPVAPDTDKTTTPPKPDDDPGQKPDTSKADDGHGEKVDKERYLEAQRKITELAESKAELTRKNQELEAKLKPPEPPSIDKEPSLEEDLRELETERNQAVEQGVSTKLYDAQIRLIKRDIQNLNTQNRNAKISTDFNGFLNFKNDSGKYPFMEEIDAGLYTLQDLNNIKAEKAKVGFDIDYESARNTFLARNEAKVAEFGKKRRAAVANASTIDGEPPAIKSKSEAEEHRKRLFPDEA